MLTPAAVAQHASPMAPRDMASTTEAMNVSSSTGRSGSSGGGVIHAVKIAPRVPGVPGREIGHHAAGTPMGRRVLGSEARPRAQGRAARRAGRCPRARRGRRCRRRGARGPGGGRGAGPAPREARRSRKSMRPRSRARRAVGLGDDQAQLGKKRAQALRVGGGCRESPCVSQRVRSSVMVAGRVELVDGHDQFTFDAGLLVALRGSPRGTH